METGSDTGGGDPTPPQATGVAVDGTASAPQDGDSKQEDGTPASGVDDAAVATAFREAYEPLKARLVSGSVDGLTECVLGLSGLVDEALQGFTDEAAPCLSAPCLAYVLTDLVPTGLDALLTRQLPPVRAATVWSGAGSVYRPNLTPCQDVPPLVHALLRRLAELAVALLPADLPSVAKLTQRILDPNQYVRRGGGLSIAAWCVTRCVPQVLLHALRIC